MKKYFGLQKVILALTTLTLVGLSSCNDQNFDWDEAHATQQYEKFSNVFIEKFGKPAEGHQWGYDLARLAMSGEAIVPASTTRAENNHFFKQDMNMGNIRIYNIFTTPSHIKKNEHDEVFAWFSTHKVDWKDNPAYCGQFTDSEGNYLNTRQTKSNIARLDFSWYQKNVNSGITSIDQIKQLPEGNYRGYNTISKAAYGNTCGDYTVNASQDLDFHNGWIQNVASDKTNETNANGNSYTSANMDQLTFRGLEYSGNTWYSHSYDFNASSGYGWGTPNDTTNLLVDSDGQKNAVIYLNVDFNDVIYHSSIDARKHDKFLLVYLKGDDGVPGKTSTWEGWYLGLDLEGYNTDDKNNQYLKTDGFCNDWIIKISDAGQSRYQNSRIMCEDLGGTISKNSSDIDYNDIVLDVSYDQNGNYVDLTPKCAGGTLPILICYDDEPLFEVHEFFLANDDQHRVYNSNASYRLSPVEYKTMINTQGSLTNSEGNFATVSWSPSYRLSFGGQSNGILNKDLSSKAPFDIDKLQIKVYRHSLDDYVKNSGNISSAEWINLNLLEDGVPLKFIIPQTKSSGSANKWLQERQMITNGYANFNDWVANPALWFWEDVQIGNNQTHKVTINESYLY